jgi:hypothetical protein
MDTPLRPHKRPCTSFVSAPNPERNPDSMRDLRGTALAMTLALTTFCSARGSSGPPLDPSEGGADSTMGTDSSDHDGTSPEVSVVDVVVGDDIVPTPDRMDPVPDRPVSPDVVTPFCGDGTCNGSETCESCRSDCMAMCPPPPDVVTPFCGDGTCNGSETCRTCERDCGSCTTDPCAPLSACGACVGNTACGWCTSLNRCVPGTATGPSPAVSGCGTWVRSATGCGGMTTGSVLMPCAAGVPQGPNRDCGWRPGVTLSCLPGRATMVGCTNGAGTGSLCVPMYGMCTGDPVIRVCPGTEPCTAATALQATAGNLDDHCGTCPSAYVTCPSSGQIHVLTGDYNSEVMSQRGTCTPAVR